MNDIASKVGRTSVRLYRSGRRTEVRPARSAIPRIVGLFALALHAPHLLSAQPALAPGEVQIERVMLPDARAGSFAFGLPGGVNVCYDPVRGGVNYAWSGGFLDIADVRPVNKLIKAAKVLGPVVYRETGASPLRRGDAAREPVVEFKAIRCASRPSNSATPSMAHRSPRPFPPCPTPPVSSVPSASTVPAPTRSGCMLSPGSPPRP